jgi:hypothetical protein
MNHRVVRKIESRIAIMKSITIHGIDDFLAQRIKGKAEAEGLSVNKTVKKLLEISLGIKSKPEKSNLKDFQEFSGLWTESDLKEFGENVTDIRVIDREDWQ